MLVTLHLLALFLLRVNVSSARFTSGSRARFYHNTAGTTSGVVSHETALQFAISASVPPLTGETYMTMDTSGVPVSKALIASAGFNVTNDATFNNSIYVSGGIYHGNNYFGNASGGNKFYTPNGATPTQWDARIQLGVASSTADALLFLGGVAGIKIYQCPGDGGAIVSQFYSSDQRFRHFGNITTETGGSVSASTFTTYSDMRIKKKM